ncbi:MAG: ABC transporter substrate-binding protein [Pseudomonadota bacterium]
MTMLEGRKRLGSTAWLRTASMAAVMTLALAGTALAQGTLNYAATDDPPHLDVHVTTAGLTSNITRHIQETLYTFDSEYNTVPLLAESETTSDDGKVVVITLRQGVNFHNGEEMMADDVVASLNRWGAHGGRGKILYDHIESVEATGDYEVTITFKNVFGPWKNLVAFNNGGPTIFPAEIVADAGAEPIPNEQVIGTGPFKFNEWSPNRYIEIVKFDDYSQPPGEADGYAGPKEVMLDAIRFIPVPDAGTRVSGVQAGDYDYAEMIPGDLYEELNADPNVKTVLHRMPTLPLVFFNSSGGIFQDNYKLRQAVMAAVKPDDALRIAVGPEDLWDAQGAIYTEGTTWYTDAGTEEFASGDVEKAKRLAEEAGYDGEPIRFMISSSYPLHHDTGQVFAKQMKDAGFNIDLMVTDWPTVLERRSNPELWDMFETTHGAMPDPILYTFLNDNYPGWWVSPEKEELEAKFTGTVDQEERKQLWAEIHALMYEQVPVIKPGDVFEYDIASSSLQGQGDTRKVFSPVFWNKSK